MFFREGMVAMAHGKISWDYLREFDFISEATKPKLIKLINEIDRIILLRGERFSNDSFYRLVYIREFAKGLLELLQTKT
jgi:hypothetical protein